MNHLAYEWRDGHERWGRFWQLSMGSQVRCHLLMHQSPRVATDWIGVRAAQNRMFHNPDVGGQIPAAGGTPEELATELQACNPRSCSWASGWPTPATQ